MRRELHGDCPESPEHAQDGQSTLLTQLLVNSIERSHIAPLQSGTPCMDERTAHLPMPIKQGGAQAPALRAATRPTRAPGERASRTQPRLCTDRNNPADLGAVVSYLPIEGKG